MDDLTNGLSKVNVNDDVNISVYNFIQGKVGNCGMISSMSQLAINKDLYSKVVPRGQNFDKKNSSKVVFHLYKLGKLHKVIVDKKLPYDGNELKYCTSSSSNFLGPLLEKALVELHFDGNYELAKGVPASFVMSSLTNNFFEDLLVTSNDKSFDIDKLINHGLETKSQMAVNFLQENLSHLNLYTNHYYAILHEENTKCNDSIFFYNPHGKVVSTSKKDFNKINPKLFEICYSDNKIFGIPEIKTNTCFTYKWPKLKWNERIHFVTYNLLVKEDKTEVLINVIEKNHSLKVIPKIFIITNCEKITSIKSSFSVVEERRERKYFGGNSLRKNLKRGKYKIVVVMSTFYKIESCEECRNYLESNGNEFLFRLAASNHCLVYKSTIKETYKIEKFLFDWHARFENLCTIL